MFCCGIGEKNIRDARKTRSVREEMVDGDGFEGRIDAEPGEIVENRLLQIDFAFLMELEKAIGEKAFADGADLKKMIGSYAKLLFEVAEAIGYDALDAIAVGEDES